MAERVILPVIVLLLAFAVPSAAGDAAGLYKAACSVEDFGERAALYRKIQEEYEGTVWAARAHLDLGEIYILKGEYEPAVEELAALVDRYGNTPFIGRARYLLAISLAAAGERERGMALMERVAREHPGAAPAGEIARRLDFMKAARPLPPKGGSFYLQLGAYATLEGAEVYKRDLRAAGLDARIVPGEVYRVVLGPFEDDIEAKILSESLKEEKGIDSFVIEL